MNAENFVSCVVVSFLSLVLYASKCLGSALPSYVVTSRPSSSAIISKNQSVRPLKRPVVYIIPLPSKYNHDILVRCSYLHKYGAATLDLCGPLQNDGFGAPFRPFGALEQPHVWYKTDSNLLEARSAPTSGRVSLPEQASRCGSIWPSRLRRRFCPSSRGCGPNSKVCGDPAQFDAS